MKDKVTLILLSVLILTALCGCSPAPIDGDLYDWDYVVKHSGYIITLYTGNNFNSYYTDSISYYGGSVSTNYGYFVYSKGRYLWHKQDITVSGTWTVTKLPDPKVDKEVKE